MVREEYINKLSNECKKYDTEYDETYYDFSNVPTEDLKAVILSLVKEDTEVLCYIPEELKNDKDIIFEAVKNDAMAIAFAGEKLKKDVKFLAECNDVSNIEKYIFDDSIIQEVKQLAKQNAYIAELSKQCIVSTYDEGGNTYNFRHIPKEYLRDVVLYTAKIDGSCLDYLPNGFECDREILWEAVKTWGMALEYASEELKNDRELVVRAVKYQGNNIKYASEELKNDKQVVLEAVKNNGNTLYYVSDELKNDKEVVLEAIKDKGHIIRWASDELKKNIDFLTECAMENKVILDYIPQCSIREQVEDNLKGNELELQL